MMLKTGVKLADLTPQIVVAMLAVESVCQHYGVAFVVTSVNDGKHSAASWHYKGRAFDVRTKYNILNTREEEFRLAIKEALGDDFDVVLEAVGTDNEHIHVEYDPKG